MGQTEELLIWYNRGTVPSICRTLSSERNASKVQFHNIMASRKTKCECLVANPN